jgi:hypothetical protein
LRFELRKLLEVAGIGNDGGELFEGFKLVHGWCIRILRVTIMPIYCETKLHTFAQRNTTQHNGKQ